MWALLEKIFNVIGRVGGLFLFILTYEWVHAKTNFLGTVFTMLKAVPIVVYVCFFLNLDPPQNSAIVTSYYILAKQQYSLKILQIWHLLSF